MPGYRPPRPDDLVALLSERLRRIESRLLELERPTREQKEMTTARILEAEPKIAQAQTDIATEKGRNDAQWTSIDSLGSRTGSLESGYISLGSRMNTAESGIATEKGRNDLQWTSIDANTAGVSGLKTRMNTAESNIATEKGRNNAQWTSIDSLGSRMNAVENAIRRIYAILREHNLTTNPNPF